MKNAHWEVNEVDDYRSARKADLATAHVAKVARIDSLFA